MHAPSAENRWTRALAQSFILVLSLWVGAMAALQQVHAQSMHIQWLADSVLVGKPIPLAVRVVRPPELLAWGPDSATGFGTWELDRRLAFDTQMRAGMAVDSAVFWLSSFSIDSIQRIRLPLYFLSGTDTQQVWSNEVQLPFASRVPILADSLKYRPNTQLFRAQPPPNVLPYVLGGLLAALGLILAVLFGQRPVLRWWARRRLARDWQKFLNELQHTRQLPPTQQVNALNQLWKQRLSTSAHAQLQALSSPELKAMLPRIAPSPDAMHLLAQLCTLEDSLNYAGGAAPAPADLQRMSTQIEELLAQDFRKRLNAIP